MSVGTSIEWTDTTWNPVRGCSRVSEGCRNCYAERFAARFSGTFVTEHEGRRVEIDRDDATLRRSPFKGFAEMRDFEGPRWTGKVDLVPEKLAEPLGWKKPRRVFVNSMSDLFHEELSDEAIAAVFGVMAAAPQHTFQVLTKRPERMRRWFAWLNNTKDSGWQCGNCLCYARGHGARAVPMGSRNLPWPLPNVWLGVSVEDQASADERIPHLLATPAQVRFVSAEPLLGRVLFDGRGDRNDWLGDQHDDAPGESGIDWVIVGGESGYGARPVDVSWIRDVVGQCRAANVPVFVKQLGAFAMTDARDDALPHRRQNGVGTLSALRLELRDAKGGDPSEWPADLRVREFPRV